MEELILDIENLSSGQNLADNNSWFVGLRCDPSV